MAEAKIKKIKIKVDNKTIKLSLNQAKELKAALDDLFQAPYMWYYPVYPPNYHPCYNEWTYTSGTTAIPDNGTAYINISPT